MQLADYRQEAARFVGASHHHRPAVGDNEFDADFMLDMSENPDWADNPKACIGEVHAALHRHSTYGTMPHSRKCRCVRLVYANSMHT